MGLGTTDFSVFKQVDSEPDTELKPVDDFSAFKQVSQPEPIDLFGSEQIEVSPQTDFSVFKQAGAFVQTLNVGKDIERGIGIGVAGLRNIDIPTTPQANLPTVSTLVESTRVPGIPQDVFGTLVERGTFRPLAQPEGRSVLEAIKEGGVNAISALGNMSRIVPLVIPGRSLRVAFNPELAAFEDKKVAAISDNIAQWAQANIKFDPVSGKLSKPPENFLDWVDSKRIINTIATQGPLMGVLMGATILNPIIGTALMVGVEGGSVKKALDDLEVGGQQVDPFYKDIAPVVVGAFNAALERFGFHNILSVSKIPGIKMRLLQLLAGSLIEGGTEGLQEVNSILAELGSGRRLTDADFDRVKESLYAGMVLGTTASSTGGIVGTAKQINDIRKRNVHVDKVAVALAKAIERSKAAAKRVAETRGELLGVSRVDEEFDITIGKNLPGLVFAKQDETQRQEVRNADLDDLPPSIEVEGRPKIIDTVERITAKPEANILKIGNIFTGSRKDMSLTDALNDVLEKARSSGRDAVSFGTDFLYKRTGKRSVSSARLLRTLSQLPQAQGQKQFIFSKGAVILNEDAFIKEVSTSTGKGPTADLEQLPETILINNQIRGRGLQFALMMTDGQVVTDPFAVSHLDLMERKEVGIDPDKILTDGYVDTKSGRFVQRDELPKILKEREAQLPPPTIKVKFIDEEVISANQPVEQYEMDIGGVKTDFFVSRQKGETVRDGVTENLKLYADPMEVGEVRSVAAEALASKNFGLQKRLTEQYHEWVRGEVKEKRKKEFSESAATDDDGNPIRIYTGVPNVFKKHDPKKFQVGIYDKGIYGTEDPLITSGYAGEVVEEGTTPNIRVAFFNIKKPFEIEKLYTKEEVSEIFSGLSKHLGKEIFDIEKDMTGDDLYTMLRNRSDLVEVNKFLQEIGFDGITHLGGQISGGQPHRVWIAFEPEQVVPVFENYFKHQQKLTKNQPPPPNLSARDLTFKEIIAILPRKFGGQWPDDKPIVDPFAEIVERDIPADIQKEIAFVKILPSPKVWNQFIESMTLNKRLIDKRLRGAEKALNRVKLWVQDTGLFFAENLGSAGGKLMHFGIDGWNTTHILWRIAATSREKIVKLYDDANWSDTVEDNMNVKIGTALEDRENAREKFTDANGELSENGRVGFAIYELVRDHYDIFKEKVAAAGRKTEENYFTNAVLQATALDQIINGFRDGNFVSTQDALSDRVDSGFLKERTAKLENIRYDILEVFDLYNGSVIKTLAYEGLIKYYDATFKSNEQGNFGKDIPVELARSKKFPQVRDEVNNWIRGLLEPARMTGPIGKTIMRIRRITYETFLRLNIKAGLDNSTQRMFLQAFISRSAWDIYKNTYRQRKRFEIDAPNITEALKQAGRDKTYLMEISEDDLGIHGTGKKTGIRQAWSRASEWDPFFMWERINWTRSEVAGLAEFASKQPEWEEVLKKHNGDNVLAIDEILGNPAKLKQAVISARQLSWQTQLMAGNVAAPNIFRTEWGKIIFMFKRFGFGQVENIIRSFQLSGTKGIAALRILARGFPEEVQHVETLRSYETLRKGIEELEALAREDPEIKINMGAVTAMRNIVKDAEKELNDMILRIQPINRNNKAAQVRLWTKYSAKRLAYSYLWNILSSMTLDALGLGDDNEKRGEDPMDRAMRSSTRNLVPFYWDIRDPMQLVSPAIFPDVGGVFGSPRQRAKGWVRWGFNSTRYVGVANRLTKNVTADFIADLFVPKKTNRRRGL